MKQTRLPQFGAYRKYLSAIVAAVIATGLVYACDKHLITNAPTGPVEEMTTTTMTTTTTTTTTASLTTTTASLTTTTTEPTEVTYVLTNYEPEYVEQETEYVEQETEYVEPETEYVEPETEYVEPETEYVEPKSSGMYSIGSCYVTGYVATGNPTASGEYPYVGGCAMSSSYPMGTRIYIEGLGEYVVNDRGGSGVEDGVIDIFCASTSDAYALTGYYEVYILED